MKLLVIGYGSIGKRHALNALAHASVGIYDNNPSALADVRNDTRFQVFSEEAAAFGWGADGVIVATPHTTHLSFAKKALVAGAHVLIEKPISHTVEGISELISQAQIYQRKIYVVCNMRFHSAITVLKQHLPLIGTPWFVRVHYGNYLPNMRPEKNYRELYAAHRAMGGGIILDAIHEIDYLRWFFGDAQVVAAVTAKRSDLEMDVEDYASLILQHENGICSEIHFDYLQSCKRRGCEIVGNQGILLWQSEGRQPEICEVRFFSKSSAKWQTIYHHDDEPANKPYELLMQNFVNGMEKQNTLLSTAEDGFAALKICLAAYSKTTQLESETRAEPSVSKANKFQHSQILLKKALQHIPIGSQTFSKSYLQYPRGFSPLFLQRGKGGRVWDVDGNEYVDLVNGLLAVLLGYCDPDVDQAIRAQLENGISFSLATELELRLTERLVELIPCAEMVRFGKNGSDATSAAIRLARAYTKRDRIAVCGYHGWQDWYIGATTRNLGIPYSVCHLTHRFTYNNIDSLYQLFHEYPNEFAAVMMEPMNAIEPRENFLQEVKSLTQKNGALLIFDEIITGFRFHLGGAQTLFQVIPDLACFGKSMGNGMPISAVMGRANVMRLMEDIFYSGTFGGESLSLAAAIAVIDKMKKENVIENLWNKGERLFQRVNEIIKEFQLQNIFSFSGKPCWKFLNVAGDAKIEKNAIKTLFMREMLDRGVLMQSTHNLSYAHDDRDMDRVVNTYRQTLSVVSQALSSSDFNAYLSCEILKPIFSVR